MKCGVYLRIVPIVLFLVVLFSFDAQAVLDSCSGSVTPSSIPPSSSTSLSFSVTNSSANAASYVNFSSPGTGYTITGGSSSGWEVSYNDGFEITFTSGSLSGGGSHSFTVNVDTDEARPAESWEVKMDDNPEGEEPIYCTGLSTAIEQDTTAPTISNIGVSSVSASQATITWTTNESANSVVEYGTTSSYGSSKSDSTMTTSHSLTLTGLTSATSYHYRVKSTDSASNTATSSNAIFSTSSSSSTASPTSTPTPTPTSSPTTPALTVPLIDTTVPVVTITTDLSKPAKIAPTILGRANDSFDKTLTVEYKIGEFDWLEVDRFQNGEFSFTPQVTLDDNYSVVVRAIDPAGNIGYSSQRTLIIDRIPPRLGSFVLYTGGMDILPKGGVYTSAYGIPSDMLLSSAGGSTEIYIDFLASSGTITETFKKNKSGFWTGKIDILEAGTYEMIGRAVDGVGNRTRTKLGVLNILSPGKINAHDAMIRAYALNNKTERFELWSSEALGQTNPKNGSEYAYLFPPGTYYLTVEAGGYKPVQTSVVTSEEPFVFNADITLSPKKKITIGPFSFYIPFLRELSTHPAVMKRSNQPPAPEPQLGPLSLQNEDSSLSTRGLRGKVSIVVILNTWLPQASQQIKEFSPLSESYNVVYVFPFESPSAVRVFQRRGGYSDAFYGDPDGTTIESLDTHSYPLHFILDQSAEQIISHEGLVVRSKVEDTIRTYVE